MNPQAPLNPNITPAPLQPQAPLPPQQQTLPPQPQAVQPVQQPQLQQTYPQPIAPQPLQQQQQQQQNPQNPQSVYYAQNGQGADARISKPKYWLTIFGVLIAYASVILMLRIIGLGIVGSLAWVVLLVFCWLHVNKIKAAGSDTLTESNKMRAIVFMTVDPLIGQAVYYFRLKGTQPQTAKILNKIGWKIFGIFFIPVVIGLSVLIMLLTVGGVQTKAWYAKNGQTLQTSYTAIGSDLSDIEKGGSASSLAGVQTACKKIMSDVGTLKAIPAYPVADTAAKLQSAADTLTKAAEDCDSGIANKDRATVEKAGTEITDGQQKLDAVVQLIENDHLGKKQ